MAAVGAGQDVGRRRADHPRGGQGRTPRPLWVRAWGGANTLAQALLHVRATRTPAQLDAFVAEAARLLDLRSGRCRAVDPARVPALHYIAMPSTPDGEQYYLATWTGISGDRFYKNAPGADFTTFTDDWVNAEHPRARDRSASSIRIPCCIHEGDTPSFLGLIDNGLASFMSPTYGGWGGRYVWRQFYGETARRSGRRAAIRIPGSDNSSDTVIGVDGKTYTSDQATIWRWRTAFQHDFAARMDWTVKDVRARQPQPRGRRERAARARRRSRSTRSVGVPLTLDAAGTRDPDGNALTYTWFFYPEAGTGIPGQPVVTGPARARWRRRYAGAGGIPSAPRAARASRRRASRSRTRPPRA